MGVEQNTGAASVVLMVTPEAKRRLKTYSRQIDGRIRGQSRTARLFLEMAGRTGLQPDAAAPGNSPLHLRLNGRFARIRPAELASVLTKALMAYNPHVSTIRTGRGTEIRLVRIPRYDVDQIALLSFGRQELFSDTVTLSWIESVKQTYADIVPKVALGYQDVEVSMPVEIAGLYDEVDVAADKVGWDADTLISHRLRSSVPRLAP